MISLVFARDTVPEPPKGEEEGGQAKRNAQDHKDHVVRIGRRQRFSGIAQRDRGGGRPRVDYLRRGRHRKQTNRPDHRPEQYECLL